MKRDDMKKRISRRPVRAAALLSSILIIPGLQKIPAFHKGMKHIDIPIWRGMKMYFPMDRSNNQCGASGVAGRGIVEHIQLVADHREKGEIFQRASKTAADFFFRDAVSAPRHPISDTLHINVRVLR